MDDINDGGPAFPAWELNGQGRPEMTCFGMTLRDYFAMAAMSGVVGGVLACGGTVTNDDDTVIAERSYELADAMLKAREVSK